VIADIGDEAAVRSELGIVATGGPGLRDVDAGAHPEGIQPELAVHIEEEVL
jgi:hypothetical protein